MNKENCALKLVDEIILYYDARSKNIKIQKLLLIKQKLWIFVSQIYYQWDPFLQGVIAFGKTEPKAMSTMEAYRRVEVHLMSFLNPSLSGQFHDPVSLLPRKQPPVSFGCEVSSRCGSLGEKSCLCWESNDASLATCFFIIKPTRCTNFPNLLQHETAGPARNLFWNLYDIYQCRVNSE